MVPLVRAGASGSTGPLSAGTMGSAIKWEPPTSVTPTSATECSLTSSPIGRMSNVAVTCRFWEGRGRK